MTANRRTLLRSIERGLIIAGAACLIWTGFAVLQARSFSQAQRQALQAIRSTSADRPTAAPIVPPSKGAPEVAPQGLVGILDVPRLGFSEVVAEGDEESTLKIAIGHLPDTPLPWHSGNSALAGHRNTHFEPLQDIKVGDRVTLATPHGDLHYVVRQLRIVMPDDISVLAPTPNRSLTLITCYPFRYIGHAPKRFVISADAVEPATGASAAPTRHPPPATRKP
ncbi:MAG: class D sortase [Vicinamibacterales bacterium]